jgi:hypothetical protein
MKTIWCLVPLLLMVGLSSCASRPPKLVPGSTVTFVNRIEPSFSLYKPEGLLRSSVETPIPNGAAIMRQIVMDEAAKAGVHCIYQVQPYEFKASFGFSSQELKQAKEFAAAAATPVTMVLSPSMLGTYDVDAFGGFVLNHARTIAGPTLNISLTSSDIRLDTQSGKQVHYAYLFGLSKIYKGFIGGHSWDTASTVSRNRAIQVMATLFRVKVADLFGNPIPEIPAELREPTTHL